MGYKNVCINCRIAFSKGMDFEIINVSKCPDCGEDMVLVNHKFKPPKKSDLLQWRLVKLLIENGFLFNPVYSKIGDNVLVKINYPKTIREAKEFIGLYKTDKQVIE